MKVGNLPWKSVSHHKSWWHGDGLTWCCNADGEDHPWLDHSWLVWFYNAPWIELRLILRVSSWWPWGSLPTGIILILWMAVRLRGWCTEQLTFSKVMFPWGEGKGWTPQWDTFCGGVRLSPSFSCVLRRALSPVLQPKRKQGYLPFILKYKWVQLVKSVEILCNNIHNQTFNLTANNLKSSFSLSVIPEQQELVCFAVV